jgi:hypothetical protein
MPSLVSKKFGVFAANAFSKSFVSDSIYFFIGRPLAWNTPESPNTASDTTDEAKAAWNNMAGAFRVTSDEVAQGISRVNWTSGTRYEQYVSNSASLGTGNGYYVLAGSNDRDVYKCLDNQKASKSIVKPNRKDLSPYREYDGYVWKYMYTISESDWHNFATANVIPVSTNQEVSGAAVGGSLLNLTLYNANSMTGTGNNYRGTGWANGTDGVVMEDANVVSITSVGTSFVLGWKNEHLSPLNTNIPASYFNNCAVMFTSGRAKGHIATVTEYVQSTKAVWISNDPATTAAAGDRVTIGPEVVLQNDRGGKRFRGVADVNPKGNVVSISIGNIGSGYSNTQLTANIAHRWDGRTTAYTANGGGAFANVHIPPASGHGYDSFNELNAKYVIVNASTPKGGGSDDMVSPDYGMEFQQMGLLRNPMDPRTSKIAAGSIYDLRTHLLFEGTTGASYLNLNAHYPPDTVITNSNNSSTGIVWKVGRQDKKSSQLSLVGVEGTFANGQYIKNASGREEQIRTSNAMNISVRGQVSQNTVAVYPEQLTKYTGELLYLENITAVNRYENQYETFKLVFEF